MRDDDMGSIADWDFYDSTTKADLSANYSLSTDQAYEGSKSLKFNGATSPGVAICNSNTYVATDGRCNVRVYVPESMNSDIFYLLLYGADWVSLDYEAGIGTMLRIDKNDDYARMAVGHMSMSGYPAAHGYTRDIDALLDYTGWLTLELRWKSVTDLSGTAHLLSEHSLYDADMVTLVAKLTYYYDYSVSVTSGQVALATRLLDASDAMYMDKFQMYTV